MATGPITVGELPAPEENPELWAKVWIAGLPCPGQFLCDQSDGDRERDTQHKKTKGGSADILIDQGLMPKVGKLRIRTIKPEEWRALYDFYLKYMDPERPLSRLNVVTISHPQYYSRGIKLAYFKKAGIPKPTQGGGIRPFIHEFDFNVINPKTQINAAGGATKPKLQNGIGGPTDPAFKAQTARQAVAGAITSIFSVVPGVSALSDRPPDQPATLLTPAQIKKLGDAGNTTARFLGDLLNQAAP